MCKKSESIKELAIALAKFNMKVKRIEDDSTNPHFKNKYASLDGIMDEIRPLLAEEGLSILQMPAGDGENFKLTNLLVHISGEWIESDSITMRPTKNDPQGVGSAITYARRYGVSSFLGLSTGEKDDDGNAASQAPQSAPRSQGYTHPSKPAESPTNQSIAPSNTGNVMISEAQVKLIAVKLKEKQMPDDNYRSILARYGVTSTKELKKSDASKVIEEIQSYLPVPASSEDDLPF